MELGTTGLSARPSTLRYARWHAGGHLWASMYCVTWTAHPPRSSATAETGTETLRVKTEIEPLTLDRPALFDTGAWTWVRDRRFPSLPRGSTHRQQAVASLSAISSSWSSSA